MTDWDTNVKKASTFSLIAVPIIVAIGGWYFQSESSKDSSARSYVKVAIEILSKESSEEEFDPTELGLRKWAVSIFAKYSPIPLSEEDIMALQDGTVQLASIEPSSKWVTNFTEIDKKLNNYKKELEELSTQRITPKE